MNCDQAFDAMTGPDRPHSRQLARHLQNCPRCRQMYETLEPALGLFAAVDGGPTETLPIVPTRLASAPARLAHQIASRLSSSTGSRSSSAPQPRRLWGAVFAAAVAGFLLSVGIGSLAPNPPAAAPDAASGCTWLNRHAVPDGERARAVVVACVTCHLSQSDGGTQRQSDLREFSQSLDRLVTTWRARVAAPHPLYDVLIVCTNPGGTRHV